MDTHVLEEIIISLIPKHITEPKYKELILLDVKKTLPLVTMEEIDSILIFRLRSEETYLYCSEPSEKINEIKMTI